MMARSLEMAGGISTTDARVKRSNAVVAVGRGSSPDCRNLTTGKFVTKTAATKIKSTRGQSGGGGGGGDDDGDDDGDNDDDDDGGGGAVGVWRRLGSEKDVPCEGVRFDVGLVVRMCAKCSLETDEEAK